MKIQPQQLETLAELLFERYKKGDLLSDVTTEADVKAAVARVVSKNLAEEESIEEEARRMLSTLKGETRGMDPYKMFLLAKQKIAAKKGFIL